MKQRTRIVLPLMCAMAWSAFAGAQHVSEAKVAVLAQNLTALQATGKVMTALWTLRNDSCTLQLVLPWKPAPQGASLDKPVPLHGPELAGPLPAVQLWLLAANGSTFDATSVVRPNPATFGVRTIAAEYSFSFPRLVNGQAVAAAIRIGDDFYIEKLETLADRPM